MEEVKDVDMLFRVVRKRCPVDGAVLVHMLVDDLWGWQCPECDYFEPDDM